MKGQDKVPKEIIAVLWNLDLNAAIGIGPLFMEKSFMLSAAAGAEEAVVEDYSLIYR